jgi:hypothetical protein
MEPPQKASRRDVREAGDMEGPARRIRAIPHGFGNGDAAAQMARPNTVTPGNLAHEPLVGSELRCASLVGRRERCDAVTAAETRNTR